MTAPTVVTRQHSPSYEIFILVLTVLSLAVMVGVILPLDDETHQVLMFYDNLICIVFLADFTYNITGAHPRSAYFIGQRGWLDLLGSIPSLGILRFSGILRLARLSRLGRIARLLGGKGQKALISDVVHNRGKYALFLTLLMAMVVLTVSSVLILQFESRSPDANITTGGDALWWAIVTITTVGYGEFFPVTALGRLTAAFVMFAGVGIIGALASILASILVTSSDDGDAEPGSDATGAAGDVASTREELAATREELAATRQELASLRDLIGSAPPRARR
jgi:voltage-gated potassium channel